MLSVHLTVYFLFYLWFLFLAFMSVFFALGVAAL